MAMFWLPGVEYVDTKVPMARNWVVWPAAATDCEFGTMTNDSSGSCVAGTCTVIVATPVTTVPSGFEAMAVITVVPFATAVATPVAELIEATVGTLELHAALLIVAVPIVAL